MKITKKNKKYILYSIAIISLLTISVASLPYITKEKELTLNYVITYSDNTQESITKPFIPLQTASIVSYNNREITNILIRPVIKSPETTQLPGEIILYINDNKKQTSQFNLELPKNTPVSYDMLTLYPSDFTSPGTHTLYTIINFNSKSYKSETLLITTTASGISSEPQTSSGSGSGGSSSPNPDNPIPPPVSTSSTSDGIRITSVTISGSLS